MNILVVFKLAEIPGAADQERRLAVLEQCRRIVVTNALETREEVPFVGPALHHGGGIDQLAVFEGAAHIVNQIIQRLAVVALNLRLPQGAEQLLAHVAIEQAQHHRCGALLFQLRHRTLQLGQRFRHRNARFIQQRFVVIEPDHFAQTGDAIQLAAAELATV